MKKSFKMLIVALIVTYVSNAQNNNLSDSQYYKVVFYNVENLFDTLYDENCEINTYYSGGDINWNSYKYNKKLRSIYKSIRSLAGWDNLLFIGLAEIENMGVVKDLIEQTPLRNHHLGICHYESSDKRGIDVALLYNQDLVDIVSCRKISVIDSADSSFKTRDILYFNGRFNQQLVHVFVVHWTSRYRGLMESEEKRLICSDVLFNSLDTLFAEDNAKNVIVMGDFNDEIHSKSLLKLSNRLKDKMRIMPSKSCNNIADGSLKYGAKWYKFDHFLVSEYLLYNEKLIVLDDNYWIYDEQFLLENDNKFLGKKPFRTHIGYKYNGGVSDHLPVFIKLHTLTK